MKNKKTSVPELLKALEDPKIREELEGAGIHVRVKTKTVRKTFEVPVDLLARFLAIVESKDLKIKTAVEEALLAWVEANAEKR